MADNFKNTSCKSVKAENNSRQLRGVRRIRRKKKNIRRKNKLYNKRNRLIRSINIRKKNIKMNSNITRSAQPSYNRWQREDEIAFWKSRAMSLQYENNMLYKHIKQMYVNMITQNVSQEYEENNYNNKTNECTEEKTQIIEDEFESQPPTEQISKKREEELKKLYGSAWRIIIGMETAIQLNYDITTEKNSSKYWPVVPINL